MISLRPGRRATPAGGNMESEEAADLPPAPLVTLANRVVIERRWWRDYCAVNERFAHRALEVAPPNALLWVHDYQLVCVPNVLRRAGSTRPIGFFLHIPFPPAELFARLPWRDHLI